jgi:HSP20 family protein
MTTTTTAPSDTTLPTKVRAAETAPTVVPDVDVFENDAELLLRADVPGASTESVDVRLEKGRLTVSAVRRGVARYVRVFAVPSEIDPSKVEAVLRSGVLEVRLPKLEAQKARRIEVKGA